MSVAQSMYRPVPRVLEAKLHAAMRVVAAWPRINSLSEGRVFVAVNPYGVD